MHFNILFPTFAYLPGVLLGGIIGALLGWLIRNNFLRWIMTFSMLGAIGSVVFGYFEVSGAIKIYPEIKFFLPAFAIVGGLIGELIRRQDGFNNWRWILAFSLLGAVAASIS